MNQTRFFSIMITELLITVPAGYGIGYLFRDNSWIGLFVIGLLLIVPTYILVSLDNEVG
jgi:hypothetical protein